ncbi:MAG: zinc ribbon domain-containing protein, partial [Candidatus Hermodarchaeota archaeon]|nr:zinc ribbon domain-containing protein [Candidatus Hermodarchaeota archaeon]
MKYCPHCGEPNTVAGARFCGKCGAALPEPGETGFQSAGIPHGKPYASMSLFDINRQYYVVRRQWWGWGSGTIHDEQGQIIGHMHRRLFTIRQKTEFREADDITLSAT